MNTLKKILVILGATLICSNLLSRSVIELRGSLIVIVPRHSNQSESSAKSTIPRQLVNVLQDDTALNVSFIENLGNLSVSVYDENGSCVYQSNVNTNVSHSLFVNTVSFEDGEYTICVTDSFGGYLIGSFTL